MATDRVGSLKQRSVRSGFEVMALPRNPESTQSAVRSSESGVLIRMQRLNIGPLSPVTPLMGMPGVANTARHQLACRVFHTTLHGTKAST